MKKTLGGDRLGTGAKMDVNIHGFSRSNHNLSRIRRMTISAGTIVPIMSTVALPGDTWDIHYRADIKTHPTLGPLFGSLKLQIDTFIAPLKLYISRLLYNELEIGLNMAQIKLPQIVMNSIQIDPSAVEDLDNAQINPSSLLACLGLRGIGLSITGDQERFFNGTAVLMYWDVYKNYYANKQEKIGAVIHTPAVANVESVDDFTVTNDGAPEILGNPPTGNQVALKKLTLFDITYTGGTPPIGVIVITKEKGGIPLQDMIVGQTDSGTVISGTYDWYQWGNLTALGYRYRSAIDGALKPTIATFPLANLDKMRRDILKHDDTVYTIGNTSDSPYSWLTQQPNGIPNIISSQEGLGLKTYNSDLFNNWLETETITGAGGINEISAVSTAGDSFEIPDLIIARKVYEMLNRIAVSGGSVEDWIGAQWQEKKHRECTTPMYMGGMIQEVVFQEVVSNSASEQGNGGQPLGTLAGQGRLSNNKKGGNVTIRNIEDPSWILAVASLTPRIDYSQGNKWHFHLKTMADLHVPMMDEIGFQDLITEQMAWWDTTYSDITDLWEQKSAGKQPAWINYMTDINEVLGNFAIKNNEMFMVLNRRYEFEAGTIKDLTTYIDPAKFNFIFAETALDSQNYWLQVAIDCQVRRLMSAKLMPML